MKTFLYNLDRSVIPHYYIMIKSKAVYGLFIHSDINRVMVVIPHPHPDPPLEEEGRLHLTNSLSIREKVRVG